MNKLDRLILNRIQTQFPVVAKPYAHLANELGISERELMVQINRFKQNHLIRRLGAVFDSAKLGFVSVLIGLKVEARKLNQVGVKIAKLSSVTHCYSRNHEFNLWFTVTYQSEEEINHILAILTQVPAIKKVLYLPAIKTFKIRTEFKVNDCPDYKKITAIQS